MRGYRIPWALIALVTLLLWNCLFTPNFMRLEVRQGRLTGPMVDVAQNGAPVMLMAIGMTLVIATGGIDLSVGSVMALAGAVTALGLTTWELSVPVAVLLGLGAGLLAGLWNGLLVTVVGLQPIVATLVTMGAGRGLAQALTADQKVRFSCPALEWLANGTLLSIPLPMYCVALLALVTMLVLRFTAVGMYIPAIGDNPRAARLCGLQVRRIQIGVYVFSGLCAGLAGLIAAADIREADVANCGLYLELDTILAVVIGGASLTGGRPHVLGSLLGAAIMQTLTVALSMRGIITEYSLIIKAITALAVCLLQTPLWARWLRRVPLFREHTP